MWVALVVGGCRAGVWSMEHSSAVRRMRAGCHPPPLGLVPAHLTISSPPLLKFKQAGEGATRVIYVDPHAQVAAGRTFESNRVVTSKYNVITFLPIFLFEMFSRVAYLYFLLQVGIAA